MELLGAIVGLEALRKKGQQVTFYTDSQYVAKAIQKGWLKAWVAKNFKGKKNEDLWRRYLQAAAPHQVTFQWIKGHAGHPENERCDQLATQAAQQGPWEIDEAYEQATSKVKTPTRGRS